MSVVASNFFLKNNSFFLEERFFNSIRKLKNTEFGNPNSVFIFYVFPWFYEKSIPKSPYYDKTFLKSTDFYNTF